MKSEEDANMLAQAEDQVMNKAVFIMKKMSADERTRELAEIRENELHDEALHLATLRAEGFEKGRAEGRAEGLAESRAELAKRLKMLGVDESLLNQALEQTV